MGEVRECLAGDVIPGMTVLDATGQPFEVFDVEAYEDGTLRIFGDSILTVPPEAIVMSVSDTETMAFAGPAQTKLLKLTEVFVPKHPRVVNGKTQSVDSYTYRTTGAPGSLATPPTVRPAAQTKAQVKRLDAEISQAHNLLKAKAVKRDGWTVDNGGIPILKKNGEHFEIVVNGHVQKFELLHEDSYGDMQPTGKSVLWSEPNVDSLFEEADRRANAKAKAPTPAPVKKAGALSKLRSKVGDYFDEDKNYERLMRKGNYFK